MFTLGFTNLNIPPTCRDDLLPECVCVQVGLSKYTHARKAIRRDASAASSARVSSTQRLCLAHCDRVCVCVCLSVRARTANCVASYVNARVRDLKIL